MKKKMNYIVVLSMVLTVAITGCKKYDEGPLISLRSKQERVANEWRVSKYLINGMDAFHQSYSGSRPCSDGYLVYYTEELTVNQLYMTFESSGNYSVYYNITEKALNYTDSYDFCSDFYVTENDDWTYYGSWSFSSNKEKLIISYNDGTEIIREEWKIIKLKEKEMKIEMTDSDGTHQLTLIKR